MNNPFKNLKDKVREIEINGIKIKVKPKVKDAEALMTLKKETTETDAKKLTSIMREMIKRANPEEDPEDIEAYVAEHYIDLLKEVMVLYGFTTRKAFDDMIGQTQNVAKNLASRA